MKANRILAVLAGLTLGTSAFAAGSNTVSMRDVRKALKASPIGLSLLHAVDANRNAKTNKIAGHTQTHIAYTSYKLSDKDKLQIENRVTRKSTPNNNAEYSYARLVAKYSRSGILTQDKHGLNLSANLEKRFYPDKEIRNATNNYGLNRISASMSRGLGKVNLSGTLYGAIKDRMKKDDDSTSTHYLYAVLTQSYSFSDSWSLSLTEELFQAYNKQVENYRGGQDGVVMTMELGHQITPAVYAGVSVAGSPFKPYDGKLIAEGWAKKFDLGANVYWSAF